MRLEAVPARSAIDRWPPTAVKSTGCNAADLPPTAMTPKFPLVDNMRRYGGNFISKLADAMVAADPENYGKLLEAFPDVVEKYTNFGE